MTKALVAVALFALLTLSGCAPAPQDSQSSKPTSTSQAITFADNSVFDISSLKDSGGVFPKDGQEGFCLVKFEYRLDPARIGFTPTRIETSGDNTFLGIASGIEADSAATYTLLDEAYCTKAALTDDAFGKSLTITLRVPLSDEEAHDAINSSKGEAAIDKKAREELAASSVTLADDDKSATYTFVA